MKIFLAINTFIVAHKNWILFLGILSCLSAWIVKIYGL